MYAKEVSKKLFLLPVEDTKHRAWYLVYMGED